MISVVDKYLERSQGNTLQPSIFLVGGSAMAVSIFWWIVTLATNWRKRDKRRKMQRMLSRMKLLP